MKHDGGRVLQIVMYRVWCSGWKCVNYAILVFCSERHLQLCKIKSLYLLRSYRWGIYLNLDHLWSVSNITHWSHSMPQSPSSLRWSPSPVSRQRAWFSISAHSSSSSSSSLHHHQHSNASSAGCWSRHHHTISQPESCSCGLVMDGASHWAEKDTGGGGRSWRVLPPPCPQQE